jgi:hypothetical protein
MPKRKESLTEDQVKELVDVTDVILQFSNSYSQATRAYTPDLVNKNLQDINLNPITPDRTKIDAALAKPKENETALVGYNQSLYLTSMVYKRNADYISNLPAFNLAIQCINAKPDDYASTGFKRDWEKANDFFNRFDYRDEFHKALFNMIHQEFYPCLFRTDTNDKYILQDFPYLYPKF